MGAFQIDGGVPHVVPDVLKPTMTKQQAEFVYAQPPTKHVSRECPTEVMWRNP